MSAKLVWSTPNGMDLVGHLARVSNSAAVLGDETSRLIAYLIAHKHWSPFEMVSACVEIDTTRDISHQIIRHRSFSFQEFSGRYAAYDDLKTDREVRMQDTTNRQSSLPCEDNGIKEWWSSIVELYGRNTLGTYNKAIERGIAKECARAILPEGLVPTKMYMSGNLRSWIHYFDVRCTPETQKEHRLVAEACRTEIYGAFPGLEASIVASR